MSDHMSHMDEPLDVPAGDDAMDAELLHAVTTAAPDVHTLNSIERDALWSAIQECIGVVDSATEASGVDSHEFVRALTANPRTGVNRLVPTGKFGRTVLALAACIATVAVGTFTWTSTHQQPNIAAEVKSSGSLNSETSPNKSDLHNDVSAREATALSETFLANPNDRTAGRQIPVTPRTVPQLKTMARADTYVVHCDTVRPIQLCGPKYAYDRRIALGVVSKTGESNLIGLTLTATAPIPAGDGDTPGTKLWLLSAQFSNPGWAEIATPQLAATPTVHAYADMTSGTVGGAQGLIAPQCAVVSDGWMVDRGHQVDYDDAWVSLPFDGLATYSATVSCDDSSTAIGGPYLVLSWSAIDARAEAVFSNAQPERVFNGTLAGK